MLVATAGVHDDVDQIANRREVAELVLVDWEVDQVLGGGAILADPAGLVPLLSQRVLKTGIGCGDGVVAAAVVVGVVGVVAVAAVGVGVVAVVVAVMMAVMMAVIVVAVAVAVATAAA